MVRVEEVIIERAYSIAEVLVKVLVLTVDAKNTSSVLEMLCTEVPLGDFDLLHLKRVRKTAGLPPGKVHILLCPEQQLSSVSTLESVRRLLEECAQEVVEVVKVAPQTKKEFQEWGTYWPMNFHPGELDRQRDRGMTKEELHCMEGFLQQLLESDALVQHRLTSTSTASTENTAQDTTERAEPAIPRFGGIMVNPVQQRVICSTNDAIDRLEKAHPEYKFTDHPILTPTMLCIEQVAAIARGEGEGKDRLPVGHYLCTGLDLYLTEEPDLMSCMALVHSRIRRVFFIHPNVEHGALLSGNGHIHSLKALNHHYRVFRLSVDQKS